MTLPVSFCGPFSTSMIMGERVGLGRKNASSFVQAENKKYHIKNILVHTRNVQQTCDHTYMGGGYSILNCKFQN